VYTNADATLYNYYKNKSTGKVTYTKTYLRGVFWDDTKQANVLKSGLATIESVSVFIPFSVDAGDKEFLPPKEYAKLNESDLSKYYTFVTNSQDFLIQGIIDYDIDNTSSQTVTAGLSYLKNNYDKVMTISVVDEKNYGSDDMRHWEIGGK
jgi:hypothetical protein